jgi:hypothetical protein
MESDQGLGFGVETPLFFRFHVIEALDYCAACFDKIQKFEADQLKAGKIKINALVLQSANKGFPSIASIIYYFGTFRLTGIPNRLAQSQSLRRKPPDGTESSNREICCFAFVRKPFERNTVYRSHEQDIRGCHLEENGIT